MESNDLDLHLTRLFDWIVNTVGRALLIGAVCFVAPLAFGAPAGFAAGAGFAGLAIYLWTANAPLPFGVDGDDV